VAGTTKPSGIPMLRLWSCNRFLPPKVTNERPMTSKSGFSILMLITSIATGLARAELTEILEVKLTPAVQKYCHVVRFPQGWKIQPFDDVGQRLTIDLTISDYEVRVQGLLGAWFLVGAFTPGVNEHRFYATNRYRVNLSDPTAPVLPARTEDWNAAAVVPLVRKSTFRPVGSLMPDQQAEFNGLRFIRSGAWWPNQQADVASRLSPDSAWLVLQSVTDAGRSKLTLRNLYKVFLDVFNAHTGEKLLVIEGTYSDYGDSPGGGLWPTAWVTERYFVVPLGEHRERCLVCEFSVRNRQPGAKP
jgi:hypothetical protein